MCLLVFSVTYDQPEVPKNDQNLQNFRKITHVFCVTDILRTDWPRDLMLDSFERSRFVDVPFGDLVKSGHVIRAKLAKNAKIDFCLYGDISRTERPRDFMLG